jgi:hypothetical protein
MARPDWLNLDGLWDLRITRLGQTNDLFTGKIRVPYPVKSVLSGVKRLFTDQERMRYQRTFEIPGIKGSVQTICNFLLTISVSPHF